MIDISNLSNCFIISTDEAISNFNNAQKSYSVLSNIKFISYQEIFEKLFYQFTEDAIPFLLAKHHELNLIETVEFVKSIPLIPKNKIDKYANLYEYRNELLEAGLIYKDDYYIELLKSKPIFIDKDVLTPSLKYQLKSVGISYSVLDNVHSQKIISQHEILDFSNASDEVYFVCNEIAHLIDKGTKPDDIYIYGCSEQYTFYLDTISQDFDFHIDFNKKHPLLNFNITKQLLSLISNGKSLDDSIQELLQKDLSQNDIKVLKKCYEICSPYFKQKQLNNDILPICCELLNNESIVLEKIRNCVHIMNKFSYSKKSIIFALNFCQDYYPHTERDIHYLSNDVKKEFHVLTVNEKNQISKNIIIGLLEHPNLYMITHKNSGSDGNNYLSSLAKEFSITLSEPPLTPYQYSQDYLSIYAASIYDYKRKYRYIHPNYMSLLSQLNIPYLNFNNKYQIFDCADISKKLFLSYSSISCFYECPFHFYLDRVLLSKENISNFSLFVGNLVHHCLQNMYRKNFDFNKEFDEFVSQQGLLDKEKIFLLRIKDDTKRLIDFISEEEKTYKILPLVETEYEIEFMLDENSSLYGKIDKLLTFKYNDINYAAIIDFKSSDHSFSYSEVNYGFSLQLPTYISLLQHSKNFADYKIIGIFYQRILSKQETPLYFGDKSNYYKDFYLNGVMIDEPNLLELINPQLDGKYIRGLTITKKGGISKRLIMSHRVVNEKELMELGDTAYSKFQEAKEQIRNNNFTIEPKKVDSKLDSCAYCPYNDICFAKSTDITQIKTTEEEGDDDGEEMD